MSTATRFGFLSRRRFATGILAFAALGSMALAPMQHASADSASGHVIVGAKLCLDVTVDPMTCPDASVGGTGLAEANGSTYLGLGEAVAVGDTWVWGETGAIVPLTSFFIETQYMDVPAGWGIYDMAVVEGDAGGSENGWYVTLSDAQPSAEVYFVYGPLDNVDSDGDGLSDYQEADVLGTDAYDADPDGDGAPDSDEIYAGTDPFDPSSFPAVQAGPEDSDGDGASDEAEIAFGSDPYDASSYPEVQAGPEDFDTDGDGAPDSDEEAFGSDPNDPSDFPSVQAGPEDSDGTADSSELAVTSLPNTGAGEPKGVNSYSEELIYVASAGLLMAGAFAGKRMRKSDEVR